MLKTYVVALCVCTSTVVCFAQTAKPQPRDPQDLQKRSSVRAAVQTKLDEGAAADSKSGTARQLSPQQREELRRQLRQQDTP